MIADAHVCAFVVSDCRYRLIVGCWSPKHRRGSKSGIWQASSDGKKVNEKDKATVEVDDDDDDFGALGPRSRVSRIPRSGYYF